MSRDLLFTDTEMPSRLILPPQEVYPLGSTPKETISKVKYKIKNLSNPPPHTHAATTPSLVQQNGTDADVHISCDTHAQDYTPKRNWMCRSELLNSLCCGLCLSPRLEWRQELCWSQVSPDQLGAVTHLQGSSRSPFVRLGPTAGCHAHWPFLGDDTLCGFKESLKARGVNLAGRCSVGSGVCLSVHTVRAGGHRVVLCCVPLPVGC